MVKKRKHGGFTLAEMLIVVAILIILFAVAFIMVQNHQRSMTQLEYDTIAKEIFIAAQNHLTGAESLGLVKATNPKGIVGNSTEDEKNDSAEAEDKIYYLVVNGGSSAEASDMLSLMLPFGAIDPTIYYNGSYIIRYQPSSARVLDVFYSDPAKTTALTIRGVSLGQGDYATLMGSYRDLLNQNPAVNHKSDRQRFKGQYVVGWYGGEDANPPRGKELKEPELVIHNEEKLWLEVTDPNTEEHSIKLIITGSTSGAKKAIDLSDPAESDKDRVESGTSPYKVILDDITTAGLHFAELKADQGNFVPGENLIIEAVAYNNKALTNIAYSGKKTTNSLFAELRAAADDDTGDTAVIGNIRHLENLDARVSNFAVAGNAAGDGLETFSVKEAKQISDMNWKDNDAQTNDFVSGIKTLNNSSDEPSIWLWDGESAATTAGKYYPVSPDYAINYDGQGHSVMNLDIDHDGNAGMFGTLDGSNKKIENVIVRNSIEDDSALEIKGGGSAGGLVGSMTGGEVTNCAAAVYVNGTTAAGGLIGYADGVEVKDSYAGGHTKHDPINHTDHSGYLTGTSGEARVNVIATGDSGSAGGLIGSMTVDSGGKGSATNCYSTCSVMGATAGGFAGTAGGEITNCYCTGLVLGTGDDPAFKAFVGSGGATGTGNWYYSIINDNYYAALNADNKDGMKELGDSLAIPFDKDRLNADDTITTAFQAYQTFLGDEFKPDEAKPYDGFLTNHYKGNEQTDYPLKTIQQLDSSAPDYLAVHCGDWPAPEVLVVNPS